MTPVPHHRLKHPNVVAIGADGIVPPELDRGSPRTADGGDQFQLPIATLTVPVFITVTEVQVERVTQIVTVERTAATSSGPAFTTTPHRLDSQPSNTSTIVPPSTFLLASSPSTSSSSPTPPSSTSPNRSTLSPAPPVGPTLSLTPSIGTSSFSTLFASIPPSSRPSSYPNSTSTSHSSSISPSPSSSTPDGHFPPIPAIPQTPAAAQGAEKSLSPGAVVGITLSSVLFALLLAICLIRRRSRTRIRRGKARTWVTPFTESKSVPVIEPVVDRRQEKRMEYLSERWRRIRNSANFNGRGVSSGGPGNVGRTGARRSPPNAHPKKRRRHAESRASPARIPGQPLPPPPAYRQPSMRRPVVDLLVSSMFPHGAVAKFNFDPTRSDELPVRAGDHLRVLAVYDDGWCSCKNDVGQKGMVPTGCLRIRDVRRI